MLPERLLLSHSAAHVCEVVSRLRSAWSCFTDALNVCVLQASEAKDYTQEKAGQAQDKAGSAGVLHCRTDARLRASVG